MFFAREIENPVVEMAERYHGSLAGTVGKKFATKERGKT